MCVSEFWRFWTFHSPNFVFIGFFSTALLAGGSCSSSSFDSGPVTFKFQWSGTAPYLLVLISGYSLHFLCRKRVACDAHGVCLACHGNMPQDHAVVVSTTTNNQKQQRRNNNKNTEWISVCVCVTKHRRLRCVCSIFGSIGLHFLLAASLAVHSIIEMAALGLEW